MSVPILLLMATMFLASVGFGVILPTLPFLSEHIGATSFELGLALSVFAIAQLLASSFWGSLSDRLSRRSVLVTGVLGYGVTSALLGLSPNVPIFLTLRFLGGVFVAAVFPGAQALVADWTEPKNRARTLGYMAAMNGIGFIFGPIIGSFLSIFGVMLPFIGVGIISVLNGLMALWLLPEEKKKAIIQQKRSEKARSFSIQTWKKSVLEANILPFLIGTLVFSMSDSSITSTLAYFIVGHLHSTQAVTGWAFAVNGGMGALVQMIFLSRIHSRYGENVTIVAGLLIGAAGYFFLGISNFLLLAFVSIIFLACCRGLVVPVLSSAISVRMAKNVQGRGFGYQQTANSIGRSLGPIIASWIFVYHEGAPFLFSSGLIALFLVFYGKWVRTSRFQHLGTQLTCHERGEDNG
jgi:DHA1 family multidrug resistance protein-like MFS transporter